MSHYSHVQPCYRTDINVEISRVKENSNGKTPKPKLSGVEPVEKICHLICRIIQMCYSVNLITFSNHNELNICRKDKDDH